MGARNYCSKIFLDDLYQNSKPPNKEYPLCADCLQECLGSFLRGLVP